MAHPSAVERRGAGKAGGYARLLALCGLILALGLLISLSTGALKGAGLPVALQALVAFDGSQEHLVIRSVRLPRAVIAMMVGAALAAGGVLMQALTRNHLASPGLFGVNAGASLLVVGALALQPALPSAALMALAFAGAAGGGMLVFLMGSLGSGVGRISPVKLALAGVTVTALLSALTQAILILDEATTEQVIYWLTGAVDGREWVDVLRLLPWLAAGLLGAMGLARSLDLLALGEDVARGLGENVERARLLGGLCVIALAGAAVAVAGPISFVGLIVPHIARRLAGVHHRRLLPLSALLGATLLLYADVAGRLIAYPFESPVGIVTAMLGAPFFLYLARRERGASR